MSIFRLTYMLLPLLFLTTACDPDDPEPVNEEELITTLNYILTPDNGGEVVTLNFSDLDGDGGTAPVITGGTLQANTTYNGLLELFNESEDPVEDISEEVEEEGVDHQFFFLTEQINASVTYIDADNNGDPIGLLTELVTGGPSSGQLTVVLRHEPDKDANGVTNGDITNAGGETDIEVSFDVDIE